MYEFDIPDMSCSHCVKAVSEAIVAADPEARAEVDLEARRARVETAVDPAALVAALDEAGYPAILVSK